MFDVLSDPLFSFILFLVLLYLVCKSNRLGNYLSVYLCHPSLGFPQVQYLFASLKALFRTEIQYGTYATSEQVHYCLLSYKTAYVVFQKSVSNSLYMIRNPLYSINVPVVNN